MGKSIIDLSSVTTVGLDLAKHVFQVHGVDASGRVIVAKALRRKDVLAFFAQLPACLALPFLGAALLGFRDFMERVDIVWAPLVRGAGIDARTTQSPAHREASPKCFTGWPCPPAGTHSNASFAAEVQSNSDDAARLRHCAPSSTPPGLVSVAPIRRRVSPGRCSSGRKIIGLRCLLLDERPAQTRQRIEKFFSLAPDCSARNRDVPSPSC